MKKTYLIILITIVVLIVITSVLWNKSYIVINYPDGCIKEGGRGLVHEDQCCFGLRDIGNPIVVSGKSAIECADAWSGEFYCSKCGNGDCGLAENECRCPSDCKK